MRFAGDGQRWQCCGSVVDEDGAPVVLQTRGGDDEVKLTTMKPVEMVVCPGASRRGEERRPE